MIKTFRNRRATRLPEKFAGFFGRSGAEFAPMGACIDRSSCYPRGPQSLSNRVEVISRSPITIGDLANVASTTAGQDHETHIRF
jgi:hypothetical protein